MARNGGESKMIYGILLVAALVEADPAVEYHFPPTTVEAAAKAPVLAAKADTSFLVRRWDRAMPQYEELVAANPTVGLYWHRLGMSALNAGEFHAAIPAFMRANELGAYQWHPLRTVYRGESAWGLAAAHARLGNRDEAVRWTRVSLGQGLRDIQSFHDGPFEKMVEDPEFRKLVWKVDTKDLSRDEGLRLDLRYLLHEIKRIHFAPFRVTSEAEIDSLASQLHDDIPKLDDDQVFVRMMAIVRRFGDGHTQLGRNARPSRLPLWFFRYPEGLYITGALEPQADLVGARVVKIGDRTTEEAIRLAEEIASRDNPMTVISFTPMLLGSTRILRGLGITSGEGPISIEVEDAAGRARRLELAPVERRVHDEEWVRQVPACHDPQPLSERQRSKTYWFETLAAERMIYCQINGIRDDASDPFRNFCARLFEAVERPEIDALVIDLRHNGGGDTFNNVPLVEGLIRSQKLQHPGRLFVVIGRLTFSAAQNTTDELERRTKAILVGEPSGSSPNFIGESLRIPLPYTGWGVSASDLWWQHSMAMDYRVWTNPQLYAPPTAAAFRAHRDVAMETIVRYRADLPVKQ
jgi:tetratricopeptide (TPR) repeat protein